MGFITDKDTGETLATFDNELDGQKKVAELKKKGKNIKVEW
jgi:hypothetical protein